MDDRVLWLTPRLSATWGGDAAQVLQLTQELLEGAQAEAARTTLLPCTVLPHVQ